MSIKILDDLSTVITDKGNNNYSNLEAIKDSYGVYIFQNKLSYEIIYIGEAKKQTLKEQVVQNFTKSDSGGTFRDNYIEEKDCNFKEFSDYIKEMRIIVIECPQNIIILARESILINVLKPKYNKDS